MDGLQTLQALVLCVVHSTSCLVSSADYENFLHKNFLYLHNYRGRMGCLLKQFI